MAEKEIISQWVRLGASEFKTLGELSFTENQLVSFMKQNKKEIYPVLNIGPPDKKVIDSLQSLGVLITPIKEGTNLLFLSTINFKAFSDKELNVLLPISDNIVEIDLRESAVSDTVFDILSKLPNLVSIKLNQTAITGMGIEQLSTLKNMKRLHLINTNFKSRKYSNSIKFQRNRKSLCFSIESRFSSRNFTALQHLGEN